MVCSWWDCFSQGAWDPCFSGESVNRRRGHLTSRETFLSPAAALDAFLCVELSSRHPGAACRGTFLTEPLGSGKEIASTQAQSEDYEPGLLGF